MQMMIATAMMLLLSVGGAFADRCPTGAAAHEQDGWEWLHNNARRTADDYAMDREPRATAAFGDVSVVYQAAGEHEGHYLVAITARSNLGTTFMMLKPRFDFCDDISGIDDEDSDLFEVVVSKFEGRDF